MNEYIFEANQALIVQEKTMTSANKGSNWLSHNLSFV